MSNNLSAEMDKLRGSGSTFSTSGKAWLPFRDNTALRRKKARLHRLIHKFGKTSDAELQKIIDDARASRP
jgi:hypothetical protein